MLGLLGLRIFEATGADITDLGEEHGHRVLRVCGGRGPPGRPDRRPPRRSTHHDAVGPSPQEPRPPPELRLGRLHGLQYL